MKNKKGFTLVELLAVIVVLAIIMVIATISVNKTITKTRTQAFEKNMDVAVKNAKRILTTEGKLTTKLLKESLDYDKNEYEYKIRKVSNGYLLILKSNTKGKFRNVDFTTTDCDSKKYFCYSNNSIGLNTISMVINPDTNDVELSEEQKNIAKEEKIEGCTEFTKKETYAIGDIISFCDYEKKYQNDDGNIINGKSEDFYVLKDTGNTVIALAKNNLMVGSAAEITDVNYGLQAPSESMKTYPIAFANIDENHKDSKGNYLGYWTDQNGELLSKYGNDYPANVYDNNSLLYGKVNDYVSKMIEIFGISNINGRLITYEELKDVKCDLKETYGTCYGYWYAKVPSFIHRTSYWIASTSTYSPITFTDLNSDFSSYCKSGYCMFGIYRKNGYLAGSIFYDPVRGVRPVITIDKSEL